MTDSEIPGELTEHRARLASSRAALERSLEILETTAREEFDLSRKLAEVSPWLAVAGFGFGVWLGSRH